MGSGGMGPMLLIVCVVGPGGGGESIPKGGSIPPTSHTLISGFLYYEEKILISTGEL